MANTLKIKKTAPASWSSSTNPTGLLYGELAFNNGAKTLWIGRQHNNGGDVTTTQIGGEVGNQSGNIPKLDEACSSGEVAVWGSTGLTGRTTAEFKSDLTINNVENTALTTWAGSTNITTLGTVGTGTWNGTAIAVAKGGTGATDAGTARTNLGLGTSDNVQFANATVLNLTVNGTTTTVNSTTVTIDDPIFTLGGDTAPGSDDNKDRGVEFRYHDGSNAKIGFFGWDDSNSRYVFYKDATNTSEVFSGTVASIQANLVGSVTGNADTVTNGVYTTGNQTIGGTKTFSATISGSIDGNAGTVTNGVYLSATQVLDNKTIDGGTF